MCCKHPGFCDFGKGVRWRIHGRSEHLILILIMIFIVVKFLEDTFRFLFNSASFNFFFVLFVGVARMGLSPLCIKLFLFSFIFIEI